MNQQATADGTPAPIRANPSPYIHDPIFFVTVYLLETVHAIGLGFTRMIFCNVCAKDAEEASRVAIAYRKSQGCVVDKADARYAVNQDVRRYIASGIINLPRDIVVAEYDRKQMPAAYRDEPKYFDSQPQTVQ